jgi:hypothetical protein
MEFAGANAIRGQRPSAIPSARWGGSNKHSDSSVIQAKARSRLPYGTAGMCGRRVPRLSPRAIVDGSLRERHGPLGEVG